MLLTSCHPDSRPDSPSVSAAGDGALSVRVQMWNSCVVLAPAALLFPISSCQHDRIVRQLQTPSFRCCYSSSSSFSPQLLCSHWTRPSSSCCLSSTRRRLLPPPSCRSSCGPEDGSEREAHLDLTDTDMRKSDLQASSSSCSSSPSNRKETRAPCPPEVKVRGRDQRPPWRYWRRTGPEPQHRQPGERPLTEPIHSRQSVSIHLVLKIKKQVVQEGVDMLDQ